MSERTLDYTVGPIGRSVLTATGPSPIRRGNPNTTDHPQGVDVESMLLEIPSDDMFIHNFVVFLSGNNDMEETYEHFDRGALQFLRPEHVAFPAPSPEKRTTELHMKSGQYFVNEDTDQTDNTVNLTIMNGGDSSQYTQEPYMHLENALPAGFRSFHVANPAGRKTAFVFSFALDSHSPPPTHLAPVPRFPSGGPALTSNQWLDTVQILLSQLKAGGKILTINFRVIEQANDDGAQVVPLLFDVTNCQVQPTGEKAVHNGETVNIVRSYITLRQADIPVPFSAVYP